MKFTCVKENLARGLQTVMHVSSKNVTLPILNNVLVRTKEGGIELVSTNLEIAIVAEIRAKIDVPGAFTVPTKTFADFVQLVSDEQISVELIDGGALLVTTSKTKTKIKGESAEEFPIIPSAEGGSTFTFNTLQLKEALIQTSFSVSRSDVRPELSGVLFHVNPEGNHGQLFLAATDSYRLSERRIAVQNEAKEQEARVIVPARTAQEIIRVLMGAHQEAVSLTITEGQLSLVVDGVRVVSRLVEGRYPDYRQIIPTAFGGEALLDTAALVQNMRAASLFSTTGVNAVTFIFSPGEQQVTLRAASTLLGEFESSLGGELQGQQEYSILLNHR
ncbi:MAG: DNA polymerase III subunit beta, partial [Patescibacteria group bacterium]